VCALRVRRPGSATDPVSPSFGCLACGHPLERVERAPGVRWECLGCGAQAVSFAVLGALVKRSHLKRLWNEARQAKERAGRACFHCREPMVVVGRPRGAAGRRKGAGLDVCTHCLWVWFDGREIEGLPPRAGGPQLLESRLSAVGLPPARTPPSRRRAPVPVLPLSAAAALLIVVGAHVLGWRGAPRTLAGAERLEVAGYRDEAAEALRGLLAERPLHPGLHRRHLLHALATGSPPDAALAARYRSLAQDPATADLGHFGLGLLAAGRRRHDEALGHFALVRDRRMEHLNAAIGGSLLSLGRSAEGERALRREIEVGGAVAEATAALARLLALGQDRVALHRLMGDPVAGPWVPRPIRRERLLRGGDLRSYAADDLALVREIAPLAATAALIIAAMWFLFLWRIDLFEQEPFRVALLMFVAGAASLLLSLLLAELLALAVPARGLLQGWLHAGLPEEVAKILPVLLLARRSWHVNEPVDLLFYGSLSALGFATLENALYLSGFGPGVAIPRFLGSTVGHMALTGLVCHRLGQARFVQRRGTGRALAAGLTLAVLLHGLSNLVVSSGPLGMVLHAAAMAALFGGMISRALSLSPYYQESLASSSRLGNFELLGATALLLVVIAFLDDRAQLGSRLAERRLLQMGGFLLMACLVFGTVGRLGLSRRRPEPEAARGRA
jgi:RsiW-degrading membrane proteinase PrsW (M82 family)